MLLDAVMIEARSIVRNLNDDIPGIVERLQDNLAARIFPQGATDFRRFQSVVHGIPNHVHQRVVNMF